MLVAIYSLRLHLQKGISEHYECHLLNLAQSLHANSCCHLQSRVLCHFDCKLALLLHKLHYQT